MECHEGNLDEGSMIIEELFADVRALPKNASTQKHRGMKCCHTKNNNKYNQDQQFEQIRVESSLDMEILRTTTKQKLVTGELRWENYT